MTREPDAEYARRYRNKERGGPPREPDQCPSLGAAKRHERNGEDLCGPCEEFRREYNREAKRRSRERKGQT